MSVLHLDLLASMEELNSPVKHRLELLERTVYALQAQQRLLEYRVQYAEDENQILRRHVTSKITEIDGSDIKKTSTQPSIRTVAPNVSAAIYYT